MRTAGSTRIRVVAIAALIALVLTVRGHTLSAQQPQYVVGYSANPVPTDPLSTAWDSVPAIEVPLIPQAGVTPALLTPSIASVTVQAIHDDAHIAFRMVWADPTRDVEAGRPDVFRDAAAIQFPVAAGVPSICMGAAGQISNIWHWKADWQEDIDTGFQDITRLYPHFFKDYYPFVEGEPPYSFPDDFSQPDARAYSPGWAVGNALSQPMREWPIENLIASGFGTLTTHEQAAIEGRGVWENGTWSVVFIRELTPAAADLATFQEAGELATAFAVWNGSNEEVGARKQLSSFVTFGIEAPPVTPDEPVGEAPASRDTTLIVVLALLGAFVVAITLATIVLGRNAPPTPRDGGTGA